MKTIFFFFVFFLVGATFAQNRECPFNYLYHLGDGVFDSGNAIAHARVGSGLPAARLPYGKTHYRQATGRWCDGQLDIDYGARTLGFPDITAYLSRNFTSNAVMFAAARSPVLDRSFFQARGVRYPAYTASLSVQMNWFRTYLNSVSISPADRLNRLANSLFLFGDVEANDITYPLIQGKSIREVRGYIPRITRTQINYAREVIRMGATRVILPGNAPMGCYPFILTELASNNTADYDDLGCLRTINDLIVYKNNDLQQAITRLQREFPRTLIFYADFYDAELLLIRVTPSSGGNSVLRSCCGIGGRYNYDSKRFCGSRGVPSCPDPYRYVFWDGIHLTQESNNRLSSILEESALIALNCTITE